MNSRSRTADHGSALTGVKAKPYGRPTAGLDTGIGHNPEAANGTDQTKSGLHGSRGLHPAHILCTVLRPGTPIVHLY